jgi:BlaI family penicillinase repressor
MAVKPSTKPQTDNPMPTDAELDILAALWRLGPSTVREVHQALEKTLGKESGYTTTLKQMQLMTDKGLLLRSERFRSHVYQPRDPKERTQKQIAGDLLKRAFDGSAKNLVMGALAAQPASDEELAEIRRLLDQFQKGRKSR